ncbi:MAG: outer membrane lipoprotein-sorting protein [Acidobacteria bacterium]|nr:outer membrane lipoprotein-sorting protein [Acidobacteriota bacterium]
MSSPKSTSCRVTAALVIAVAIITTNVDVNADLGAQAGDLLRRSDVGAFVPTSFRARLSIARGSDAATAVEIWRSGADRTLLRFLTPKEAGKFLLRRGTDLWLIAPNAKQPVKLAPSHRIYGAATMDVLFSLRLAEDYDVVSMDESASRSDPLTVYELRARAAAAQYAQVRYEVNAATARPERAEYRLRSGRPATRVNFDEWSANQRYARRVEVTDLLRKDPPTRIEVVAFEERPVPDTLFDPSNNEARQQFFAAQDGQSERKQNH